ncbi:hypothetical protein IJH66_01795 [Candidatus Saccharibacteria bacterium]|nr:hypothetical protein [Candidatus Saccharibacteria bacterium]
MSKKSKPAGQLVMTLIFANPEPDPVPPPEVSFCVNTKKLRRQHEATNFVQSFRQTDERLDEWSPGLEAIKADYRKCAERDADRVAQAGPSRRLVYIECYDAVLRRLERANAIEGGLLCGIAEDVFYDVYLATLDALLEERNVLVVAPRDLRQFGEPVRTLEDC